MHVTSSVQSWGLCGAQDPQKAHCTAQRFRVNRLLKGYGQAGLTVSTAKRRNMFLSLVSMRLTFIHVSGPSHLSILHLDVLTDASTI